MQASHSGGFSSCGAQVLDHTGSVLVAHWLNLPGPVTQPVSPALAGRFYPLRHQASPALLFLKSIHFKESYFFGNIPYGGGGGACVKYLEVAYRSGHKVKDSYYKDSVSMPEQSMLSAVSMRRQANDSAVLI